MTRARLSSFIFYPSVFLLLLSAFCLLIAFLPLPLPPYLDFQVLYHADLGLLQGIPLYDRAGQAEMIANLAGVTPDHVFVLPFPYPPWYALSTIFLALPAPHRSCGALVVRAQSVHADDLCLVVDRWLAS